MRKKHILIISQYFYPEPFRINDMAADLVKRGYKVTVLTGVPNYPEGRVYPDYKRGRNRRESYKGCDIIRIPLKARGSTPLGLVMNYASFVISGWFWKSFTRLRADLVFSWEVSPMTQVRVGCGCAKKMKVPHYVYVQDLWPENVRTVAGVSSRAVLGPIDRMVDKIYSSADMIFVTSPSFKKAVTGRKKPVNAAKVHYLPQYAEDFYVPLAKAPVPEIPDDGVFTIAFTGNIGSAQGLEALPEAAALLKDMPVRFVIVGDGRSRDQLVKHIAEKGVEDRFILVPRRPPEEIPAILAASSACFISFRDDPLFEKTIPAKLQSYMACGKPIIAAAKGETQRIVEEADCGVCVGLGDPRELAEAIRGLMERDDLTALGSNARRYFERHFTKDMLMDKLDAAFMTGKFDDIV